MNICSGHRMTELTEKQRRCLRAVCAYIAENQVAPTRRELAEALGQRSVNGVNQHLDALERKHYIRLQPPNSPRNIEVLRLPQSQQELFARLPAEERE